MIYLKSLQKKNPTKNNYREMGSNRSRGKTVFSDLFILIAKYIRNFSSDLYKFEILLKFTL